MDLPQVIKVACYDIKVVEWNFHEAAHAARFGEFSNLKSEIKIDMTVDRVKIVDTLLHEISHAIFWAYGIEDEDKEERIVGTTATAWTQVFRDNPRLMMFIHHNLHSRESLPELKTLEIKP